MVLLGLIRWYNVTHPGWEHQALQERIGISVLAGIFITARFQLACTPALLINSWIRGPFWVYFRTTLNFWNVAAPATFLTALNRGALQYAAWSTVEILFLLYFIGPMYGMEMGMRDFLLFSAVTAPFIFLVVFFTGMLLCGMGVIGAMVSRHPAAVISGVLLPYVVTLVSAGPDFIRDFITGFSYESATVLGTHPATLFFAIENRIISTIDFAGIDMSAPGSYGISEILRLGLLPGMFAFYIWAGIWVVMWTKLREPEK